MITPTEIMTWLFQKLKPSALATEITGTISKFRRDPNSKNEDVVINSLGTPNIQLQRVIANVNIHVPDLQITVNGQQDRQPNLARLDELTKLAVGILDDTTEDFYHYDVQQVNIIEDQDAEGHFSNLRIEFFIENL